MKNALSFLLAFVLALQARAYDFEAEGLYFNITGDNTAEVTYPNYNNDNYYYGYTKPIGALNIPAKVINSNTGAEYNVTSIGSDAFCDCSGLTSITVPESVTSIGPNAFYLVKSVIYSGSSEGSPWNACAVNGFVEGGFVYIDNAKTQLAAYVGDETEVIIPNDVTSIGNNAFCDCSGLTSVIIPNSVTSIGSFAFEGCSSLTTVTIPNSVTSIGNSAFCDCIGLTAVNIPNSVTSIGSFAFLGCSSLTSVAIPNTVTTINNSTFEECSSLETVIISNSVVSIEESAFYGCTRLRYVTIGKSVTNIGYRAFERTGFRMAVVVASIESLCGMSFANSNDNPLGTYTEHLFIAGDEKEVTDLVIPNAVTSIGKSTFRSIMGLKSVTIPNTVTTIEDGAFNRCENLMSVTILAPSLDTYGARAFDSNAKDRKIYVPKESVDTYKAGWPKYADDILPIPEDNPTCVDNAIIQSDNAQATDDAWHSLDGRKLLAKPTERGVYLYKGRKIVVK